ncbi:sigma-70 family RNA polymerase sigma factor [Bacillus sp. JJ1609]|uniref:RNA polymerase sigma factor n=1 Tax=Bacillus sp. JJ1609 TaxID=3122977 RepID=UPI002FFEB36A
MQTDKRLVAEEALEEPKEYIGITQFYPRLQQYCQFLTQNGWDGDDLFQETIIKAIRHYESTQINSALLKKIAYHHWVDTIRKRKHEVPGIPEYFTGLESAPAQNSAAETVELLLEKMTPKQAVIFILKEAFRFQSPEIAGLLGMTEMAVKGSLHRARKRLEKEGTIREVDSFQNEKEEKLLSSLLSESLQAQDPTVLLENIHDIPSLFAAPKMAMAMHSSTSLSSFKMAA